MAASTPRRGSQALSAFDRRTVVRWGLTGGAALTAGGALLGCRSDQPGAAQGTAAGEPVRGGTLRVAYLGEPTGPNGGLDPQTCTSNCYPTHQHLWDTLVRVNYDIQPEPMLAESWTTSPDGKTWTFKLRSGVKHHHGTMFTAEDVVHTFRRILDPRTGSVVRTVLSFIDGVEAPDAQTAVFHLKSPNADLLYLLGVPQTAILPRDRSDDQLRTQPTGTGPFMFSAYNRGERVVLRRNPEYWQAGLPYLDELHFLLMPEPNARVAALIGGRVDMIAEVQEDMVAPLQQPRIKVEAVPSGNVVMIAMRMDQAPFTDNRVREAFKIVTDRKALETATLMGTGSLGNDHPFFTGHPFYDPSQTIKTQDIERARRLLADAGFPNGLEVTLHLNGDRGQYRAMALAYQEQARKAGINVRLQHHPDAAYWADIWMKTPLFMSSWNFRPSPDEYVSIMFHSQARWNESGVNSPELDRMIETARGEMDPQKRKQMYFDIQRWVSTNGGVIMPIFRSTISAWRENVGGYRVHAVPWWWFHKTWVRR